MDCTLVIHYVRHEFSEEALGKDNFNLAEQARQATFTAYSPYSHFCVGAAVLLDNGETVCGSNQENAAFGAAPVPSAPPCSMPTHTNRTFPWLPSPLPLARKEKISRSRPSVPAASAAKHWWKQRLAPDIPSASCSAAETRCGNLPPSRTSFPSPSRVFENSTVQSNSTHPHSAFNRMRMCF